MNDTQFQSVKSETRRCIAHLDLAWQIQLKLFSRNVAPNVDVNVRNKKYLSAFDAAGARKR